MTEYAYNDARLVASVVRKDVAETIASVSAAYDKNRHTNTFTWDGLALIQRGDEHFLNEPHVGGGDPVASSKGTTYFNDMLGTTVGSKSNGKYSAAAISAFGERLDNVDSTSPAIRSLGEGWFTGKPHVAGLGHAFLMLNYRAGLGKWQTADPMGYPDGWNALAYCGNGVADAVDLWGCELVILDEVYWCGLHLATVWADCNHDYSNPSFAINLGKLEYDPKKKKDIKGDPKFDYDNTPFTVGDITYTKVDVSFEKNPSAVPDKKSDPFNCIINWQYQIKLTITRSMQVTKIMTTESGDEFPVVVQETRAFVERQASECGDHYIPE